MMRDKTEIGCVILTGNGPSKHGKYSFSSGETNERGKDGYGHVGEEGNINPPIGPKLHILEVQRLIRFMPKVVIAAVPGWAVGGGHSYMLCVT